MNFQEVVYPIEGNVQRFAHFSSPAGTYQFSYATPYCYSEPANMKEKMAFILAAFNVFNKAVVPNEVYCYYTIDEKVPHPDRSAHADIRKAHFFDSGNVEIGSMDIYVSSGFFRMYKGLRANPIYDEDGKVFGFAWFDSKKHSKNVYLLADGTVLPEGDLGPNDIKALEDAGKIRCIFVYDIVQLEADARSVLESIFSPSKKSELSNNRIARPNPADDPLQEQILLLAAFAFFWATYVDIPLDGK